MCDNHNYLFGKDAVYELIAIELGQKKACNGRVRFLEQQAQKFSAYVESKGGDYEALKAYWVRTDFQPEQYLRDEGLVDCMHQTHSREGQLLAEEDMSALMDETMEANVRKAYAKEYGIEGNLRFWEMKLDKAQDRLSRLQNELKVFETIQDYLDSNKDNPRALVKAKARIQDRMAKQEIEYETYSVFMNQINGLLEKLDGRTRYRVTESKVQDITQRIDYFVAKVNEFKAKVEEAHLAVFQEVEEPEVDPLQEIASEGFKLCKNEKDFQQVVEFIHNNQ